MNPKLPVCEICGLNEKQSYGQTSNHICTYDKSWDLKLCPMCRCMTNHDLRPLSDGSVRGCLKCKSIRPKMPESVRRCVDDDY